MNDFRDYSSYTSVYNGQIDDYTDYLSHHGILGMHWGIRRYQNKDGTLTEAGKKRFNKLDAEADKIKDHNKRLKAKAKARKYGTETPQERDEKTRIYEAAKSVAEKHGFKADDWVNGNFTNNKRRDIVIYKDVSNIDNFDNFMKQVDDFNKNYKEHNNIMKKAAATQLAKRFGVSESQMRAQIEKTGRPFINISDTRSGGIYLTADYDIGDKTHWATVEYDPKTKRVYSVAMNG